MKINHSFQFNDRYQENVEEMSKKIKNISLHVIEDLIELLKSNFDEGTLHFFQHVSKFFRTIELRSLSLCSSFQVIGYQFEKWNTSNVVLNVTYVEEKQKNDANVVGQLQYEFFREDYNECFEMFTEDLSKLVAPDTADRLISLLRIIYGNKAEIATALVSGSRTVDVRIIAQKSH